MTLKDFTKALRKGWLVIVLFTLVGTGVGIGLIFVTTRQYQATVQLFVATSSGDSTNQGLAQGNTFAEDRVQSYISIATSQAVTVPVIENLGLTLTPSQLSRKITAQAPANKVIINLSVTNRDPDLAARIANETAEVFSAYIGKIESTGNDPSVVKLTVFEPAAAPNSPITPNKQLDIGVGLAIGLLVGLGLVVLRSALDNTVKGPEDFAALGVPVLGLVPFDKRAGRSSVAFRDDAHSSRSEAYRQLRTNMQFVDVDNPPRVIAVTSALPGEGKTTTAINFAAALAEAGFRVCLIDADLRRPSVSKTLGLVSEVGFTSVLVAKLPIEDVLQNAGRNLAVLASGPVPPNPSELLISTNARNIISDIADVVDFVVIDTPPLLPVSDAAEIATIADATLMVVRSGKTTREQTDRALDALERVDERPVGVILNMLTRGRGTSDYNYAYYYGPRRDEPGRRTRDKASSKTVESTPAHEAVEVTSDEDVVTIGSAAAHATSTNGSATNGTAALGSAAADSATAGGVAEQEAATRS